MPLKWIQEERWHAKGESGNYYKVFPFMNMEKFGASVTRLDENGDPVTEPVGGQYDTAQAAKDACGDKFEKALRNVQAG